MARPREKVFLHLKASLNAYTRPRESRLVDEPALLQVPEPEAACRFVREHAGTRMLQLVGPCTIDYQGRAQSQLGSGERLVLIKPDGTLLVHTHEGVKPVNWQPPGTKTSAAVEELDAGDPRLIVTVERSSPDEIVTIAFEDVHVATAFALDDVEDLELLGTEEDIHELLRLHPDLVEEGFTPYDMELDRRRGPMDIYGHDAEGTRTVVEVKRRTAGIEEATQLARYVERERDKHDEVRGLLAAPGVSDKAKKYLDEKSLEHCDLDLDELMPKIPRVSANQQTLGAFDETD
jgi:RecB family endonuclease NucS